MLYGSRDTFQAELKAYSGNKRHVHALVILTSLLRAGLHKEVILLTIPPVM